MSPRKKVPTILSVLLLLQFFWDSEGAALGFERIFELAGQAPYHLSHAPKPFFFVLLIFLGKVWHVLTWLAPDQDLPT
jgi:hypothetical protein